jgi:diguanylate cyclase (GGDEF)-like protein/PAS domain S-box-containing protein
MKKGHHIGSFRRRIQAVSDCGGHDASISTILLMAARTSDGVYGAAAQASTTGGGWSRAPWADLGRRVLRRLLAEERHLPWLVLLLGLLITAGVCEQNRRLGQQAHTRIERALMDDVADAITTKLQQDIEIVSGVAGLFSASPRVSREDFRRYYQSLNREENSLDGIQGIGFTKLLTPANWKPLEAEVRREGFSDFRIRPAGVRAIGSTILYLEPFNLRNQRAFGFDMYSESVRREAMDRAALSGMAALSGKVRLLQETSSGIQAGVLIYVPIYSRANRTVPTAPADYPETLVGWAYSPIRVGDLVGAALRTVNNHDLPGSAVLVYEGAGFRGDQLMFDNQGLHGTPLLTDPQYQRIDIGGRIWMIGIQLNRSQIGPSGITPSLWVLGVFGAMASALAAMVTQFLVTNHARTRAALATAEQARSEQALAAVVFEASPQAIVVTDPQGQVISANQSFARITGYTGAEILGRTLNLLKSGRHEPSFYKDLWRTVQERGFWQGEIWNRLRSGEIRRHELSITTVRNQQLEVSHYMGMIQDVSERHQAHERIRHRSLHDQLTGLANRSLLMELADRALALAERNHYAVGLLFLDLDGFKPINDRYGHALGDRVLQMVARLVLGALRTSDTLARLGGDEFVVMVPKSDGEENLRILAHRIQTAVAAVNDEVREPIALSVSIGIAYSPVHGITVGQLMAAADAAMYDAKRITKDRVQVAREAGDTGESPEEPQAEPGADQPPVDLAAS